MSEEKSLNFIEEIVEEDLKAGKYKTILTRFPPEPNGYLHIGHAKSICLNFGLAKKYGGSTNLRFDDTNPVKEDIEYVDSIKEDVEWLGFKWANELYASDYFEQLIRICCNPYKERAWHMLMIAAAKQLPRKKVPPHKPVWRTNIVTDRLKKIFNCLLICVQENIQMVKKCCVQK